MRNQKTIRQVPIDFVVKLGTVSTPGNNMPVNNFQWFKNVVRGYVETSEVLANIYQAVLDGVDPQMPDRYVEAPDGAETFQLWVGQAHRYLQSIAGKAKLRRLISEHRYDAGFCVDDISLRRAYEHWTKGEPIPQLPRLDGMKLRRMIGQLPKEVWQDC